MNIVVNDLLTYYEIQGKGQLVVLLHGWGDSSRGLADLSKTLAKDYQVLTIDLPGFGQSETPRDVWNLDNYADFVAAILDKLKLKPVLAIIGHSNGGAIAIRGIALGKLEPQKLVLLAASGVRSKHYVKRATLQVIAKTGNLATIWLPKPYRRALRSRLYGVAGSDMLIKPQLEASFKQTVRQDIKQDAAQIKLPTLLIYADQDRAVELSDGQTLRDLIKGSRLEVIKGAGHFLHQEEPAEVSNLIEEFLK